MIVSLACFNETNVKNTLLKLDQIINIDQYQIYECWAVEREAPAYKNSFLIQSNNRLLDFSSWHDSCQKILKDHEGTSEIVLFLNDTVFDRKYSNDEPNFIDDFFSGLEMMEKPHKFIYGYIDDFPKPVKINGVAYSSWIRSNLFAMSLPALKSMSGIIPDLPADNFIDTDLTGLWGNGSKIMSDNLKAYLASWLFGMQNPAFSEYSLKWHSAKRPTEKDRDFFEKKIRTILCEHSLGLSAQKLNIEILDSKKHTRPEDRWTSAYYGT